jgi:ATP-dependent Clp protease ATP-binding subunit ClpB
MTSNIGSDYILQTEKLEDAKEAVDKLLHAAFKPEFLNRIDEIIMFNRLGKDQIDKIISIELDRLSKRLKNRKYNINFTKAAKEFLAGTGFDPLFGARPLKRTIQNYIENPLAKLMLSGSFVEGDTINVDSKEGAIKFTKKGK